MLSQESLYVPEHLRQTHDKAEAHRSKLVSWIFDSAARYKFKRETAFLAANIADRILGLRSVAFNDLALLGITSLFMAAKYE